MCMLVFPDLFYFLHMVYTPSHQSTFNLFLHLKYQVFDLIYQIKYTEIQVKFGSKGNLGIRMSLNSDVSVIIIP